MAVTFCAECGCVEKEYWEKVIREDNKIDILCGPCYDKRFKIQNSLDDTVIPPVDASKSVDTAGGHNESTAEEPKTSESINDERNVKANLRRSTSVTNGNNHQNIDHTSATKQIVLRNKNAKMKSAKHKVLKSLSTKGKSRRHILKRNPMKAPSTVATVTTSEFIFHKNIYWQVGDVVSIIDEEDGDIYYAQLQGFFQSEHFNKSAIISWLLPGRRSPEHGFDPSTYTLGPEETKPINMDCFEFICHNPLLKSSLTQLTNLNIDSGYILSSTGQ